MPESWDQILGDVLETARRNGELAHHPQHGRPLSLERERPYVDAGTRVAHKLLKDAGYSLPWIEAGNEIESGLKEARADLARARQWQLQDQAAGRSEELARRAWQRAQATFRQKIARLNKAIFDYNLHVPVVSLQKLQVDHEAEVRAISTAPLER